MDVPRLQCENQKRLKCKMYFHKAASAKSFPNDLVALFGTGAALSSGKKKNFKRFYDTLCCNFPAFPPYPTLNDTTGLKIFRYCVWCRVYIRLHGHYGRGDGQGGMSPPTMLRVEALQKGRSQWAAMEHSQPGIS